ncbi:MAG: aspartate-semialdehyde dehydrogenase [Myxococcota bacterium]
MSTRCAVVGATGIAGQQFLSALADHPFLEVSRLAASSRSAGRKYVDALRQENGQVSWYVEANLLDRYADIEVHEAEKMPLEGLDLVFSAVETNAARGLEARFAEQLPVVSTASAFRYEPDVPIIIPAVNGDHAGLLAEQRENRGWRGYVVPIPNCTTTGLAIALAPLHRAFGVERVVMTSLQAVSGAGRTPGVSSMDIIDNIVPFIPKEEEKVERETQKLLGAFAENGITPAEFPVSATCTRVPVLEAHTEAVTVALSNPASVDEVREAMVAFGGDINPGTHPSAPERWLTLHEDPFRPQPRVDRDADGGMTTSVGRLRRETVLGQGVRFLLVSHNTKMGAAKGAILVAEDLKLRGWL